MLYALKIKSVCRAWELLGYRIFFSNLSSLSLQMRAIDSIRVDARMHQECLKRRVGAGNGGNCLWKFESIPTGDSVLKIEHVLAHFCNQTVVA